MRTLRYSINVTLDGCCHHEAGLPPDEESMAYWTAEMERADAVLFGRVTYEMMESAWRRPASGTWPDWMGEWEIPFAEAIDATKKYVVSSTLDEVDWNAELVQGDLGEAVQRLKQEPGEGLSVGGVTLPSALADLGLIDEYEPGAAGPRRTRTDVARRSARPHRARAGGSPRPPIGGGRPAIPACAHDDEDLGMTVDSGAEGFEGATFVRTSFRGATLRSCDLSGVTMRSVDVGGLDIDSHDLFFGSLIVNGVDVVPLVDAELNRQFPGRELQSATMPEGLRGGWVAVQAAWETTVTDTLPRLVDAHVEDEWSLAQTLRHLVLATDAWLRGGVLGMEQPFHEIGLIFSGAAEMGFDTSIFRADTPAFEEILAVRAERQQMVTDFLSTATPELLAEARDDPWGGGDWHPTVGDCVRVILEEEWAHLRYVRRDLALLG